MIAGTRVRLAHALGSAAWRFGPVAARRKAAPVALREVFDDLGGTFTKFGQLIGSAPSIFGEEVSAVFRGCLDAGPPVPFRAVRVAVETELGRPLEQAYASFEEAPLAAASIAVVHRAVLHDGTPVAVKVLRPGIEHMVATDLDVMRPLFGWIGRNVAVGVAGTLPGLIDGLREQIVEELDLRREAASIQWFAGLLGDMDLPLVQVPDVYPELSGRTVLTMELLDGVPIDDATSLAEQGVDVRPAIEQVLKAWFATALCTGVFHGDIHAGNLLVDRHGRIAVLDWGIMGRMDDRTHRWFVRMIEGALGDETAWEEVAEHFEAVYGSDLIENLGMTREQGVAFVRSMIEPLFQLPFGQVDLRTMLLNGPGEGSAAAGADRTLRARFQHWQSERRFQRTMAESGGAGSSFDRGTFLLSKQLVFLDRYGKLYLPDTPLLWDRQVFETLLANARTGNVPMPSTLTGTA
ncbi:MAG: ABC1 kinase family protein [Actinomycetota bacterium]